MPNSIRDARTLKWTLRAFLSFGMRPRGGEMYRQECHKQIRVELNRVERGERTRGKLVQVELRSSVAETATFSVARSDDNLNLLAEARLGEDTQRGRVLPVRNRSTAQLLCREMEILCNDQMYQEAMAVAAQMLTLSFQLSK